jgi:predicted transcriptional regulator
LFSGPLEPLVRRSRLPVEAIPAAEYSNAVSIELPGNVEEQLRNLAAKQGRDVRALVEEAIRQYLDWAAISDVDAAQVAEAQIALFDELPPVSDWKADDA